MKDVFGNADTNGKQRISVMHPVKKSPAIVNVAPPEDAREGQLLAPKLCYVHEVLRGLESVEPFEGGVHIWHISPKKASLRFFAFVKMQQALRQNLLPHCLVLYHHSAFAPFAGVVVR
eukprot:7574324-Pyramimonas_sp.AAC.2